MIKTDISLKPYNTFGLDYRADKLIETESEAELVYYAEKGELDPGSLLIIGGGSNLLFLNDYHGTVLKPVIEGIRIEEEDKDSAVVSAGAGVEWDRFAGWCVDKGLGGVENLSLIPGNTGAAPVQNIGAYGSEAKDTVTRVRAYSLVNKEFIEFSNSDCRFGYRESIFKGELKNNVIVTRVYFRLSKRPQFRLNYGFLEAETAAIGEISLKNIRQAVINIRLRKLPDPSVLGNAGSFFKNPVVSAAKAEEIRYYNPLVPVYDDASGGKKIAAGWLIEQCGWKGRKLGNAGVHSMQALVLVNHGSATGREIYDLSSEICRSVKEKFGIELQREVEVIGSI
jgi:UDP-N-acetylmuramate dehydrogenase